MFKISRSLVITSLGVLLSFNAYAALSQKTVVNQNGDKYIVSSEDFSPVNGEPSNVGNWFYGSYDGQNLGTTKNVGQKYFRSVENFAFHSAVFATSGDSVFTGDYLTPENRVTELGFATKLNNIAEPNRQRAMTLMLVGNDGFFLYKKLANCDELNLPCKVLLPTEWTTVTFQIPANAKAGEKEGWMVKNLDDVAPTYKVKDHFDAILKDVKQVQFAYQDPANAHQFQFYNIDSTDVTITRQNPAN